MKSYLFMAAIASLAAPAFADPGFISLEGSDATAFHMDPQYTPQLFKYLQGSSSKKVLVYNPSGTIDLSSVSGGVGITNVTSLVGVTLSDYSAIYIESPGGCCVADNTVLNGFGASVAAFVAAGGNLSIENYVGGDYDGVVPGGAAPFGTIEGFGVNNGGLGSGPGCTDGETVTALGLARGFTQPPIDGCWSHQAYESAYWEGLGYVSLMASSPDFSFGDGTNKGSSFLAIGGSLGSPSVPEPATWGLFIGGFGVIGASMRRRQRAVLTFS